MPRSTDRVVQALSTLAALLDRTINEVRTIDTEWQDRLNQTIQDAESTLERREKEATEQLQTAVAETETRVRTQVTNELRSQFNQQIGTAIESIRRELSEEREKLSNELQLLTQAAAQWEIDKANLHADVESANQALREAEAEHKIREHEQSVAFEDDKRTALENLRRELQAEQDRLTVDFHNQLAQAAAQWETDRSNLERECERTREMVAQGQAEYAQLEQLRTEAAERDKKAAVEAVRRELQAEQDKLVQELNAKMAQAAEQWEAEKAALKSEFEVAQNMLTEAESEHRRLAQSKIEAIENDKRAAVESVRLELQAETEQLRGQLSQLKQKVKQWESERAQMVSEHERLNRLIVDAKAEHSRLTVEVSSAKAEASAATSRASQITFKNPEAVEAEIARIVFQIENISKLIDDPATELSVVIRKNVERAELDSYLKGIRFALKGSK
jgi:chromosome segregation ATPase